MTDDLLAFYLFGDQSSDTHGFLSAFYRQGGRGILATAFLDQAGEALRKEVDQLPKLERSRLPTFRTLQQLNERHHGLKVKHQAVDAALLCISQLAHYIDHSEKNYQDIAKPGNTFLVGLCSGLFAASAIASASSLSSLVPIAVQAVLLAFRTGSHVQALADRLHPVGEQSQSWTHIFQGVQEAQARAALVKFQESSYIKKRMPNASQAYISAISANNVAISGPPSTLSLLSSSGVLGRPTSIPVYGPYHAPHLHASVDVKHILRLDAPQAADAFFNTKPRSAVMSGTTGAWIRGTDTKSLFEAVVHEILSETLMFAHVLDGCLSEARDFGGRRCLIIPFGPTQNAATLSSLVESQTSLEVVLRTNPYLSEEETSSLSLSSIGNHGSKGRDKLAVVGMAGRFPDAASHEKLWELLEKGLDVHRVVPADRFPVETHVDPTGKAINSSHTPYGCWIEKPGMFDPRFFNMSPREAFQTDPMQRMALTTAYEALEMSGYVPNRTSTTRLDRIGTFYGQTSDDWREINAAQEVDTYFITGGVRAFGPGRINYHFGFSGPSLNIDTACSSSAAAMQVACSALWARDCDTALVGGLSCMTNSDIFSGLSRGQFLSKTGPCATFDNDADGYCRGDGCATVVVKRLEDALAEKDNVLAVILGTATNHSADAISITHPHGPTQSILSSAILDEAGVDPLDVDYVEMHGTGTQAGDGTEMKSVTNVFAPADRKRPADRPLYLGAVKANVGHGEAASGVTALVKVLMMLQKNSIPPHVGIKKEINKGFPKDLSERNVNIAFHMTPFRRRDGKPRRVFINNFSAAGGNTGLLIEDAPKLKPASPDPRNVHVVTLTGKSKAAMIRNAERLVTFMERNPETPLSHVAYSTTARRIQHYWRMNVAASTLGEARQALKDRLCQNFVPVLPEQPKVAFLFTGQGAHFAGMGHEFYNDYSIFRQAIDEFDQISQIHGFPSFLPLINGSEPDVQKLSPVVVQLGQCCFEMALARLWESWGIKPAVVVGHSLGEYAALNVAGVLSASDTIYLVGTRANILVSECAPGTHSMLAIKGSALSIIETLGPQADDINVACINSPTETVLSGTAPQMDEISQQLDAAGFKCTQLKVPFAFHSAQVDPILDSFEQLARSASFKTPRIPIISPLHGKLLGDEPIDSAYLRDHAREPVNFLVGLVSSQQAGVIDEKTVWLEVGPHPVCANLVKAAFGVATIAVPTVRRNEPAYKTLSSTLCTLHTAGLNIDWDEYHRDFDASIRLLDLPSYSFDEKNYWLQYSGDWCLTKNRGAAAVKPAMIEPPKPKLSTSSVHAVTKEEVKGDIAIIETESDMCREDLRLVVTGHLVNGIPLCPSSLYGDMAMTVCEYAYKLLRPDAEKIGVNVAKLECPKTLIFDEKAQSQILRLKVTANAAEGYADVVFTTGEGAKRTEHGMGRVRYGNTDEWSDEFERAQYLIHSRVQTLLRAEKEGTASKVGRGLAYKLFSALVDYAPRYRGMEEVVLDSSACEATAKIKFQTSEKDGNFKFSPYWIDSFCHISGFIINGTDAVDSREHVYISHGWGSMRFIETPDAKKTYRNYIRMQPIKGTKMYAGDAYIFDGDRIIGMAGDIRFQCIPRKVLNLVLPPRGAAAAGSNGVQAAARASPAPVAAVAKKMTKVVTASNIGKVNQKLTSVVSQVIDILAKEVGVSHDELADNIAFNDLGVDSLMSLTVSGRIREELELDLHSNAFVDYPTLGSFKGYLAQLETSASAAGRKESVLSLGDSSADNSDSDTDDLKTDSAVTTPDEDSETSSVKDNYFVPASGSNNSSDLREIVRETIAVEMAVEVEEIMAAPDLANLGMDSLMSLQILGTLREKTGLEIPSDLFVTNPSLKDVERCLGINDPPKKAQSPKQVKFAPASHPAPPAQLNPDDIRLEDPDPFTKAPPPTHIVDHYPHRKATSVLLSGSARTATRNLFMIPDGSGCATSYTEIADVGGNWAVWGLFSPFMKTPEEYNCGVYGMATKFITEMKRRQPSGPYSLAGWSAGGVISYEIVNQLIKAGDEVSHVVFIDAPCPITIEPLPKGLHAWFASIGLLGDANDLDGPDKPKDNKKKTQKQAKIPEWLLPHFAASVTALSNYTAEPLPADKCPAVTLIWCEDGVCNLPTDPRPRPYPTGHALFLLDNRTDFGPNRWEEYMSVEKMTMRHMPGNHFSMMHGKLAKQLGGFLREAVL